ncbi:permease [Bacillus sp. M6-12]|uniref:ABC transporter permease n=1 Tax=Bacillus sp. M6-12 TaxID=2054166 RepID=UPI000C77E302|nr:ABC transporter permease [Bacillus sp. M6-12]PLS17291.1 permease [Bacillus sp. M6-12]
MVQILSSDFLKIKRKMIWFLVFLGPIGVIGLEALNFGLRYEYLTDRYKNDLWGGLIGEVRFLSIPALMIGLTIIISMIANVEHQTNSWKQLLALPITKFKVFTSKFLLASILLFVSCTLLFVGTILFGVIIKYGTDIPLVNLLKIIYYPFLAAMPFIALQTWISITFKNQANALTIGILGTVLSLYSISFPDWVPYKWPLLENHWGGPIYSVIAGVLLGLAVYLAGLTDFTRKEVK